MKNKLALSVLAILPFAGVSSFAAGQTGTINFEFVNIRVNPSIDESVSFVLKKGDKVEIISEQDGWYNIKIDKKTGWAPKNTVKIDEAFSDTTGVDAYADTREYVDAEVTENLDEDAQYVDAESVDSELPDTGTQDILHEDNLKTASKLTSTVTATMDIRNSPGILGTKLGTVYSGDVVEYISINKGWAKIKKNGVEGYVSSYYLKNNFTQGGTTYKNMGMTLDAHVNMQIAMSLNIDSSRGWTRVSASELKKYMNPNNYTDYNGMMQFVALNSYSDDLTASQLNAYLNKYCKPGNVFYNQGQAFINAAKKYNINVLYLVGHSMIETGYGTSKLASGVTYNGKKVYNFFGIGAVDGNALGGGSATAYKNGWTSVAAGIDGAAGWISSKYIHNSQFNQYTLYEMKWNTNYIWHQYASDVAWPSKIGIKMADIGKYSTNLSALRYVVPKYK